jgi:hypothetical protein
MLACGFRPSALAGCGGTRVGLSVHSEGRTALLEQRGLRLWSVRPLRDSARVLCGGRPGLHHVRWRDSCRRWRRVARQLLRRECPMPHGLGLSGRRMCREPLRRRLMRPGPQLPTLMCRRRRPVCRRLLWTERDLHQRPVRAGVLSHPVRRSSVCDGPVLRPELRDLHAAQPLRRTVPRGKRMQPVLLTAGSVRGRELLQQRGVRQRDVHHEPLRGRAMRGWAILLQRHVRRQLLRLGLRRWNLPARNLRLSAQLLRREHVRAGRWLRRLLPVLRGRRHLQPVQRNLLRAAM